MPIVMALFFVYAPAFSTATYYPEGPQENVSKQTLIDGGWTLCWEDYYWSDIYLEQLFSQCQGDYLIFAGGHTNSNEYLLLAAGERNIITTRTQQNETIFNNGSYWYNSIGWGSIGFAPNSTIQQSSADVYDAWSGTSGHLRLSWHSDGLRIFNGWRVGMAIGLNGSTDYQRAVWQTSGVNIVEVEVTPEPTETPSPEPTEEPSPEPEISVEPSPEPQPSPQNQDPAPTPTPTQDPEIKEKPQEKEQRVEIQQQEEEIILPSEEPTPIIDEIIIDEPIISEEEIKEQIKEQALEKFNPEYEYELDEIIPLAEVELEEEELLELLEELDPDQPIEYVEGVILEAGVAAVFMQLSDPAALFEEILSDPAQVVEALGQLGADMTEEEREQSEEVIVAAVIVSQLIGSVTASMVTQVNARAEIRRVI